MSRMASSPARASPRLRPETGFTTSYLVKSPTKVATTGDSADPFVSGRDPFSLKPVEPVCHGLLRDTKAGGARSARVTMPDPLVFYSWWNEELATPLELQSSGQGMGVRRQVRLHYLAKLGTFQLFTEDVKEPLTQAIEHADGTAVGPYELYVGAKLDVLGRPMTLRSAAAQTIGWIDAEAKRLLRRREALCDQVTKFKDLHKALESVGIAQLYLNRDMSSTTQAALPTGGKANLHRLSAEVAALEGLLVRYRS